jgi:hypothetical protein
MTEKHQESPITWIVPGELFILANQPKLKVIKSRFLVMDSYPGFDTGVKELPDPTKEPKT